MGRGDAHALLHALFANDRQAQCLAPVVVVHLVPGLVHLHGAQGLEAGGFGGLHGPGDGLPLGLGGVHKGLVTLGERVRLLQLPGARLGSAVGAVVEKLLGQRLGVNFFVFLGHFQILQSLNFA